MNSTVSYLRFLILLISLISHICLMMSEIVNGAGALVPPIEIQGTDLTSAKSPKKVIIK